MIRTAATAVGIALVASIVAAQPAILVYDQNTNNGYAATAASTLSTSVTVADSSNFNTLLTGQAWSLVLVDCPSTVPGGGWTDLINYVNGGGATVMSFWDWDNDSGQGDPGLAGAFDFTSATSISLTDGVSTLTAAATPAGTAVFFGVPGMPHSSWFNSWLDDGDAFGFTGATALADLSDAADPVMILNSTGNAIAAFVIDEWSGLGAVELWENMGSYVLFGEAVGRPIPVMHPVGIAVLVLLIAGAGAVLLSRFRIG
jgi:hypothetical protein